jgi:SMC interacting uncharacterized protein involved in chromosome segregation
MHLRRIEKNCGVNNMGYLKRMEKTIIKREKAIEKERNNMEDLKAKVDSNEITKGHFNLKKAKIDHNIRVMDAKIRTLKGMLTKEKRRLEEKREEKGKK